MDDLAPEARFLAITNLEKVMTDCRDQLYTLRAGCHPHYYELSESKIMVKCIGCGDTHVYNSIYDKLFRVTLPTIQKAPPK